MQHRWIAISSLVLALTATACSSSAGSDVHVSAADTAVTAAPTSGVSTTTAPTTSTPEPTSTAPSTAPATTGPVTTGPVTTEAGPALVPATDPVGTVSHASIVVDGIERTYRVYVPSHLPDSPVPLVIALHGGFGWGDQFAQTNHVESLAESNGFLVVHPDGVKMPDGNGGTWNGGACCGRAAREQVDDVGFIAALIDAIEVDHAIDTSRIVAFGHSNGAIMSYRLACELSDRIAGVGMWAGALEVESCTPARPVSVIHGHGDADRNIPIEGGVGPDSVAGVDFAVPHDGFTTVAAAAGCAASTTEVAGDISIEERAGCVAGTAARFVTIHTANHAWPGGTPVLVPAGGRGYDGWDATAEIVAFLLAHPRP